MYDKNTRIYPSCCTAAYCGSATCDGCPDLPTLNEFKAWRLENNAHRPDPIWCPSIWTARPPVKKQLDLFGGTI